ncbi:MULTISPECIES: hypothetical protein [unclassified Ensifer]|uniref:hypothetical protein n=1 Tax=unclassified Ensifer TaxID=2633371 RepID=UPI000812E8DF|nr:MULTISPECIES: hypothetical protein [unclassified Ensifer]OCP17905.1 hypothetical protein BC361_32615 [Ensifer sp. LC54]OCP17925.1 hypothetical protein BC363_32805 [Ensifer sp. LC384]
MVAVEQCVVEAPIKPGAPFAMQLVEKKWRTAVKPTSLSTTIPAKVAALARSDRTVVGFSGWWRNAIALTSAPDASANQTLAIADKAVSTTMIAARPQASCQLSENQ